jgi:hypothetical protein
MRKIFLLVLAMMLACISVSAVDFQINFTVNKAYQSSMASSCIYVTSLRYEPYPVNPGEYFTLWIKAENVGNEQAEDVIFELVPKYPFSLDSNENPVREYGKLAVGETVAFDYKIRVDKDAVHGENEIELRYKTDKGNSIWAYDDFDIQVEDAQTDFDLVIQEVSDSEVSIAIANVGKTVAYSVIVRIPEQEAYAATGTDGQMVGNLENGDYTLVGFEITKKRGANDGNLKVQIDYTDNIGERRSVIKDIPFDMANSGGMANSGAATSLQTIPENFGTARRNSTRQTAIYQQWWFWAIIVAVLYAGWRGFKLHRRKKQEKEENKHKK